MKYRAVRGATIKIDSTVYTDQNQQTPADLTGASVRVMFKKQYGDLDGAALLTKDIGTGVTVVSAVDGAIQTAVTAAETNSMSYTTVFFEILVKLANGEHIRSGVEEIELLSNVQKVLN